MLYDYSFYPTLLDSYFRYKKSEDELSFIQLFDKINQVAQEADEARLKGIAFEKLINEMITVGDVNCIDGNFISNDHSFNSDLVLRIYEKLKRCSEIQSHQQKVIDTPKGMVKIYGVFDYKFPQMTADLKTTASYRYGKYEDNMQHKFISLLTDDKEFNYIATDFEYLFFENYWLTDKVRKQAIEDICEFIDFINHFKKYITNTKIFGNGNLG